MGVRLRGVKLEQNGTEFVLGCARVGDLLPHVRVDEWAPSNEKGYQREVGMARAREFGRFMARGGFSPTTILLNIRDEESDALNETAPGEYSVPDGTLLWVVDGQHRVRGLESLCEQHPALMDIELPVVVMRLGGGDDLQARYNEALQFLIINRTQKGVRSDLAERILLEVAKMEGTERVVLGQDDVLPVQLRRDMSWKPRAVAVSDLLNKRKDSPLRGRIKLPNQRTKGATVSQVAVVASLKPILDSDSLLRGLDDDRLATVLINFWSAIRDLCPAPFEEVEESGRADDYVLLKTTGVTALHRMLPGLLPFVPRRDGAPVMSAEALATTLKKAGDFLQPAFWHSAGEGTAGAMGTSQKTFSSISTLILDRIAQASSDEQSQVQVVL